jgi:hypothetical protein
MNSAPDLSFFLWMAAIVIGLICVMAPLLAGKRYAREINKLTKLMALFSTPPQTEASLKKLRYDIPKANLFAQIVESWFPHDETEQIAGAPAPVCGRFSKQLNHITGDGAVALEVFYDIVLPQTPIPVHRRRGKLTMRLHEDAPRKQTEVEYIWEGAELAVSDLFSIDAKILRYFIDRIKNEFRARGYSELSPEGESQALEQKARALGGRQAKQWWRTYDAGATGQKQYSFWPNPQDYAEAVQNPKSNFKDQSLQLCNVVVNDLGIPRVASGMFASVYQMRSEEELWALRCFDTRLIDQQERYKAISSFILSDDLTYTVDFHYLEDGIKCGDTWFPVLKMTWVEGQALDAYVSDIVGNYSMLEKLRWEFQTMMVKMRLNGIAHGDLQHGNILVSSGEIYLVDYDGFYVPELAGKHSNELGHANFQHPKRTESVFAPYMDNFSAQLIDFSLLCLMEDPSLWQKFNGGDECLLLRKADLVNPAASKLVSVLNNHESGRIREGVRRFLSYLDMAIEDIPYLESDAPIAINTSKTATTDRVCESQSPTVNR